MLGNLHVRFGVGAGGETPPAYTTWEGNDPGHPVRTHVVRQTAKAIMAGKALLASCDASDRVSRLSQIGQ